MINLKKTLNFKANLKIKLCIFLLLFLCMKSINAKQKGSPCCPGDNIFYIKHCVNDDYKTLSNITSLHCEIGKYMLDPSLVSSDTFSIAETGDLILVEHDTLVSKDSYCTTNYIESLGSNLTDSRKIAIVCFHSRTAELTLFLVKGVLAFISVAFLLATLYVYWIIPELRETQDKVTCFTLVCLTILFFSLGIIQVVQSPETLAGACVPLAYITFFSSIAYFTWLNLIMLNVWKTSVLRKWKIKEKKWYSLNHLYGWTVPLTLLLIVYMFDQTDGHIDPGFGNISCFFEEKYETWIFLYVPISIMLTINIILVLWSVYGIHRHGDDISPDRKKAIMFKCKLYLKLFILAGVTWIFEVLSHHFSDGPANTSWYWIIADVINALHGVLIFFVLIIGRQRIKKELAGRRILCFVVPERWSIIRNAEEEQLNEADTVEENTDYRLIDKKIPIENRI